MQLINSCINNTNYSIQKPKEVSFSGVKIKWVQSGFLQKEELEAMHHIRESFDTAASIYSKMNNVYQLEFKKLYPELVSDKLRGFTFHSRIGDKFQIQKTNNIKGNNELLTFSILDKNNKAKLHFKVNNDGDIYISDLGFGQEKIPNEKLGILKSIESEMQTLKVYAQNFTTIRKKILHAKGEPPTSRQLISRIDSIKSFEGYIEESKNLLDKFNRVNRLLNKNQGDMSKCKEEFFDNYAKKAKGWSFINPHEDGSTYTFCPSFQKTGNTLFSIAKINKAGNQNVFLFFSNGKIARPIELKSEKSIDWRSYNLEFLTKEEIEKNNLKNAILFVDQKIDEFEQFILERRHQTPETAAIRKQQIKQERLAKALKLLEEKHKLQEPKTVKPKAKVGRPRKNISDIEIDTIPKKRGRPRIHTQKETVIKEKSISTDYPQKAIIKDKKIGIPNIQEHKTKVSKELLPSKTVPVDNLKLYKEMSLECIINSINNILRTPVAQRSPHLIHEKFPNGRIFEGRFQIKAKDGSKVMVSRVKSSRFYNYTYLSVRVTKKDGMTYVMNIDPEKAKIIDSLDGKPVIDKYGKMKYYTTLGFLRKNPWAADMPMYFEEIFRPQNGIQAKLIPAPKKSREDYIMQTEREIQKILRAYQDEDFPL